MSTYRAVHREPHDYRDCPTTMDILRAGDARVVAGRARRAGVTAPGTPARGVYELVVRRVPLPGLWAYEDGAFVPLREWYAGATGAATCREGGRRRWA